MSRTATSAILLLSAAMLVSTACGERERARALAMGPAVQPGGREVPAGDAQRGRQAIRAYGCGACHVVPGVIGATGLVGPPLTSFAQRSYIAGKTPNTAPNLVRWVQSPQAVEPGTAMPNLGVGEADARDIAAYLYTLR